MEQEELDETLYDAVKRNSLNKVRECLERGANVNSKHGIWVRTPLHCAALNGNLETTELLISSGADLSSRDRLGDTPLHNAAQDGVTEICQLLIKSGSDQTAVNKEGDTSLHYAAQDGVTEICQLLIKSGSDQTAVNKEGDTPLHDAARVGNTGTCQMLISFGSDPTAVNNEGDTPLHKAARAGNNEIPFTIVFSYMGETPLHKAAYDGNVESPKLLIIHGVDLLATTKEGKTPLDIANARGNRTLSAFLEKIITSNVPPEVYLLSSIDSDTFGNVLKSGFYRSHVGKILIVGHEAVGKTAISNVLVGKVPSKTRMSTEGIAVHIYQAAIDLKNKGWIPSSLDIYDVAYRNLMVSHKFSEEELSILEQELPELESQAAGVDDKPDQRDTVNKKDTSSMEDRSTKDFMRHKSFYQKTKSYLFSKRITTESLLKETKARRAKVMKDEDLMPVNMMDFGGQYVFYSTHQSFLTYRGFYLLPVNGSLDFDEEITTESFIPGNIGRPTGRGFVLFWVSSITTCSVGSSGEFPKIFVFLTHRDRIDSEVEASRRAKYIFEEIRKMFQNTKVMANLILEPELFINAMDPKDPGYRKLESTIMDHVCSHPTWGEKLPKAWIPLQLALQQNIEKGEKVMSMDTLRKVNRKNPVQVLTEQELQVFLKMVHTQGEIIFFPLPGLKDKIILSPMFFVECLRSLVTESSFCSGNRREVLAAVSRNGVLHIEDIKRLWRKKKELSVHEDHLISVMVHLDILASPRKYNKVGNLMQEDYFFVPSLIKGSDESVYNVGQNRTIGLSFKFFSPVIPPAIGYRLIASCIDLYEVKRKEGSAMLFSGMAVLAVKRNLDLIVVLRNCRVDIYLVHNETSSKIVADTASGIAECIKDILSRIVDSFKIMSSESKTKIPDLQAFAVEYTCPNMKSPCYNDKKEDWICKCGFDIKREIYSKWTTNRKNETCEDDCPGIGEEGFSVKPSELQLAKLALQFSWEGYLGLKELLLHLGLKEHEMLEIEVDSCCNNLNTRFLCLRKWKQKINGTIGDIYEAMEKTGNDRHLLCRMNRDRYLYLSEESLKKKVPSDRDLDGIAAVVITESLILAVHLDVPSYKWEQMKTDNYKIVNINREILGTWREEATAKNKMQELAQALCNIGIDITYILQDL